MKTSLRYLLLNFIYLDVLFLLMKAPGAVFLLLLFLYILSAQFLRVGLLVTSYISFLSLLNFFISLSFLKKMLLPGKEIKVDNIYLLAQYLYCVTSFWPPWFQMRYLLSFQFVSLST